MSRLIDADCINFYKATVARGTHSFDNVEIVEKFQIDRMPTIDPESLRPRARWLGEDEGLIPDGNPFRWSVLEETQLTAEWFAKYGGEHGESS